MKREILIYLGGRFIPAVVNLTVIVLAVRFLGPAEYGRYSLLLYTVLIAVTLSFHWVQVSILRFLGSMPRETNIVQSRFFDLTLITAIFSTLAVAAAGRYYFKLDWMELGLVSLFAFLNHFYLFHIAILQAYHRSIRTAILEGSDQLIILLVMLAGIFLFNLNSSALIFGSFVLGFAGAIILRFLIRVKGLLAVDVTHLYWDSRFSGKVFNFGYSMALWLFFSHLLSAADRFLVMEFQGYADAGSYSAMKDLLFKGVTFACMPIFISYQSKVLDSWNAHRRKDAWAAIKEALSFEFLVFIILFIIFMVVKEGLFRNFLRIPSMDSWKVYLPVLMSAFLWQMTMMLQRFLDLMFRQSYLLIIIGICAVLNIGANLLFVPRFGFQASSLIMFGTVIIYSAMIVIFATFAWKKHKHL